MIQYDTNGTTLYYIDANGNKVTSTPMSGDSYSQMLQTMDEQQTAKSSNAQIAANYNQAVANAQLAVNAGQTPQALPPAPLMQVVSDTGVVTYVAFVPPLSVLVAAPQGATGGQDGNGSIAAPSIDKLSIIYNEVQAIYRKEFPNG